MWACLQEALGKQLLSTMASAPLPGFGSSQRPGMAQRAAAPGPGAYRSRAALGELLDKDACLTWCILLGELLDTDICLTWCILQGELLDTDVCLTWRSACTMHLHDGPLAFAVLCVDISKQTWA